MLILWIYVKVHLYFCVGYEAEWRNFHKQSGSDQSFSVSTRVGKREHTFHFLWIGGGDSQPKVYTFYLGSRRTLQKLIGRIQWPHFLQPMF